MRLRPPAVYRPRDATATGPPDLRLD